VQVTSFVLNKYKGYSMALKKGSVLGDPSSNSTSKEVKKEFFPMVAP
jgi:hypothetical protein